MGEYFVVYWEVRPNIEQLRKKEKEKEKEKKVV